jgi:hypothetical protein
MKFILTLLISCNFVFAEEVKIVRKGEIVPYDGVLFSKDKEKEVRTDLDVSEKKIITLKKLNELNEKEIEILDKRLQLYQKKSTELAELQVKNEKHTSIQNVVYFISGALITGVIGYGVIKAYR